MAQLTALRDIVYQPVTPHPCHDINYSYLAHWFVIQVGDDQTVNIRYLVQQQWLFVCQNDID